MTREELIRMAHEVGILMVSHRHQDAATKLERFAELVAAAERERAQQIVEGMKPEMQARLEKTYMEGAVAGAKAEREACAKVCDNYDIRAKTSDGWIILTEAQRVSSELATKIRARNNNE